MKNKNEAVKPRKWVETIPGMWMCGNCGESVNVFMTECPKCGKEIAWDGRESTAHRMSEENQGVER